MNSPDAHELLTVANETLLSRVLPAVPKELEYEVRMIARAMSISARELRQGHRIEEAGRKALAGVLGSGSDVLSGDAQRLQLCRSRPLSKSCRSPAQYADTEKSNTAIRAK